MSSFIGGQRVRINPEAWGDSTDPEDVEARGQIVTLQFLMDDNDDDPLWEAELPSGTRVYPVESELEEVPE